MKNLSLFFLLFGTMAMCNSPFGVEEIKERCPIFEEYKKKHPALVKLSGSALEKLKKTPEYKKSLEMEVPALICLKKTQSDLDCPAIECKELVDAYANAIEKMGSTEEAQNYMDLVGVELKVMKVEEKKKYHKENHHFYKQLAEQNKGIYESLAGFLRNQR